MKIGIVGSRRRDTKEDQEAVESALNTLLTAYPEAQPWIISGGCPKGGDRFAEIIAKKHGYLITIFHANWQLYGRGAGFIRNTDIAKTCDFLIACVAPDRKGGTEDTIKKAERFGKEVLIVR